MIVTGVSGSGKTHFLRMLIHQLCMTANYPVRFHLIDVHEDIFIPGASSLKFTSNMPYGYNPLIIDPDPDTGGPAKAVASFIDLLSKTANYKLGDRQVAAIQNILMDMYASRGFFQDKVSSWRLDDGYPRKTPKSFPTVRDAYFFANKLYQQMFVGINNKALAALRNALKAQRAIKREKKAANNAALKTDESKKLLDAIDKFKTEMNNYIHLLSLGDGDELDKLMKYPNQELFSGVVDRLAKLDFMGIFSGVTPPFDPNAKVWRYCLKSLERDESIMFVNTVVKSIFNNAKARGVAGNVMEYIIIDEAKRFQNPDGSIFDVISAESRKFGLGLISASQAHSHFTDDAIQAAATQVILNQDASVYNKVKNLTGIPVDLLASIKPRSTALAKVTTQPKEHETARPVEYQTISVNTSYMANRLRVPESQFSPSETDFNSYASQQQKTTAYQHDPFAPQPSNNTRSTAQGPVNSDRNPAQQQDTRSYEPRQAVHQHKQQANGFRKPSGNDFNPRTSQHEQPAYQQPAQTFSQQREVAQEIDLPDSPDFNPDYNTDPFRSFGQHPTNNSEASANQAPASAVTEESPLIEQPKYEPPSKIDLVSGCDKKTGSLIENHFSLDDDDPDDEFGPTPLDEHNALSIGNAAIKPKAPPSAADVMNKLRKKAPIATESATEDEKESGGDSSGSNTGTTAPAFDPKLMF
jgi:hypothetical protein